MANIVYAEIVGTRMAEEGSGGFTTNYTSYSVLVYYSNGVVELVEGNVHKVSPYLPYMRPRGDMNQLKPILDQMEQRLERSIRDTVQDSVNAILVEQRNPLPGGLTGKSGSEAKAILEEAGFRAEYYPVFPAGATGTVLQCERKKNNPMTIVLKMKYDIPDVTGLDKDTAIGKLKNAGFTPVLKINLEDVKNPGVWMENSVVRTERGEDLTQVNVFVYRKKKDEYAFCKAIEDVWSDAEIYSIWKKTGMAELYPFVDQELKTKLEFEKEYGCARSAIEDLKKRLWEELVSGVHHRISDDEDWLDDSSEFVRCPQCQKRVSRDFIRARRKCPECGRLYRYQKLKA